MNKRIKMITSILAAMIVINLTMCSKPKNSKSEDQKEPITTVEQIDDIFDEESDYKAASNISIENAREIIEEYYENKNITYAEIDLETEQIVNFHSEKQLPVNTEKTLYLIANENLVEQFNNNVGLKNIYYTETDSRTNQITGVYCSHFIPENNISQNYTVVSEKTALELIEQQGAIIYHYALINKNTSQVYAINFGTMIPVDERETAYILVDESLARNLTNSEEKEIVNKKTYK